MANTTMKYINPNDNLTKIVTILALIFWMLIFWMAISLSCNSEEPPVLKPEQKDSVFVLTVKQYGESQRFVKLITEDTMTGSWKAQAFEEFTFIVNADSSGAGRIEIAAFDPNDTSVVLNPTYNRIAISLNDKLIRLDSTITHYYGLNFNWNK